MTTPTVFDGRSAWCRNGQFGVHQPCSYDRCSCSCHRPRPGDTDPKDRP